MHFVRSLRRLWRHPLFRRLLAVRIATQAADGTLQVGMASYVLFSPQQQPDAWSIAAVLAITLLPFSILGPFISTVLDRWSRRQVVVWCDTARTLLSLGLAALIVGGERTAAMQAAFFALVLVAMSLNRFLLAGLSAGLPHTVDSDEYLIANSVMPTVGPAGVLVGAGVALGTRLVLSPYLEAYKADAVVFCIAAAGFVTSVLLSLRIGRPQLGPLSAHHKTSVRDVARGLVAATRHLRRRPPALLALTIIGVDRVIYGVVMVGTILIYRNYFHPLTDVDGAMADLGLWAGATGAGFVLSAVLTPPMTAWLGLRRWMVVLLTAAGVVQVVPGSIIRSWTLVTASFFLGLASQSLKICVDTLVQAHVDDGYKGRLFVLYDMVFNAALVVAAVVAAVVLPANGVSVPIFAGLGIAFALTAALFSRLSWRIGDEEFHRGTESIEEDAQRTPVGTTSSR